MKNEHQELMELKHEPEPGYKKAFYVIVTMAALYLAMILFKTL